MKRRLWSAFKSTVLFYGAVHLLVLSYLVVSTGNITYLNAFSILDLHEFIPGIEVGTASTIVSIIITATIFFLYYSKTKRK